ncbi:hypothetical protein SLA2020_433440 [Shorea laevis]
MPLELSDEGLSRGASFGQWRVEKGDGVSNRSAAAPRRWEEKSRKLVNPGRSSMVGGGAVHGGKGRWWRGVEIHEVWRCHRILLVRKRGPILGYFGR